MPSHDRHVPAAQRPVSYAGALPATPDIATVEQEYLAPPTEAILVQHNGPIASRALPTRSGAPSTFTADTHGDQVLGKDLKRCRLTLISSDNAFYYSSRPVANWSTASAALIPPLVPLVLLHGDAVYCASAVSGMVATIAVVPENTDGT
jgi:hypothetical protein